MNRLFIFCHGFGFDKSFWDNMHPYYADKSCLFLDLGYFGPEDVTLDIPLNIPRGTEVIGVGHSVGFLKLLKLDIKFDFLIGLNSFTNFLGSHLELRHIRGLELESLKRSLMKSPNSTLERFYLRCGAQSFKRASPDIYLSKLLDDLELLQSDTTLPKHVKILILGSEDDIVVPKSVVQESFFNREDDVSLKFLSSGSHALGLLNSQRVYEAIEVFLNA